MINAMQPFTDLWRLYCRAGFPLGIDPALAQVVGLAPNPRAGGYPYLTVVRRIE